VMSRKPLPPRPCPKCGRMFKKPRAIVYCSRECAGNAPKASGPVACPVCGGYFTPRSGRVKFCSRKCNQENIRRVRTRLGTCRDCGAELVGGLSRRVRCDVCLDIYRAFNGWPTWEPVDHVGKFLAWLDKTGGMCRSCGDDLLPWGSYCSAGCRKRGYRAAGRLREKSRYKSDPAYRLKRRMKNYLGKCLRDEKDGRHWETLVGFTLEQLRAHLASLFLPGMTWENYGRVWHVDHIIPLSRLNIRTPEDPDFRRGWALSNLQPMFSGENIAKGNRLSAPLQPSLSLGVRSGCWSVAER
jgi:hypothetical protein